MPPLIGIDLGTTNSLVCTWRNDKAELIKNAIGEPITPSVISYDEKNQNILVGRPAKERLISHPQHTVACFKRFMGTNNSIKLGKKAFSPVELSALVLKQLKADAEAVLGEEVTEAIISVPAYFNDTQRAATKLAGDLAGLKVERLINEPTAAALAYGITQDSDEQLFIVIDLGGGTLDVSILDVYDDIIEVRASAGDNFFGGEDFDDALQVHFTKEHKIKFEKLSHQERSQLAEKTTALKHALSDADEATLSITLSKKDYQWTCTREDFENIIKSLIQRFNKPIERALRDSKVNISELNNVILVGGATRMPWVRSEVSKLLKRIPASSIDPDQVVALGTAVQAALKARNATFKDVVLTDVCPYSLGVDIAISKGQREHESGHFLPIIERNTTVPVSREERLVTIHKNQRQVSCGIYQGESRLIKNNVKIGELTVEVPKGNAGEQYVDIRFTYDINGILEVIVKVGNTGTSKRITINNSSTDLSQQDIDDSFKKLEAIKLHPRDDMQNRHLIAKLERLYEESLGGEREYIAELLVSFETALNSQDPKTVEQAQEQLASLIKDFESSR
jgi:molecular chaperone HscC